MTLSANQTVREIAVDKSTAVPAVVAGDMNHWREATLQAVTDHILERHHGFVRRETPRLLGLFEKVRSRHDQNHPELPTIEQMFNAMSEDLRTHMLKEEQILFPHMRRLEAAVREGRPAARPPFGTVANPIARMMAEHDNTDELLTQMRSAAHGYGLPDDACPAYEALYRGLEEFEQDLHLHVRLENDILFPRAVEMERSASGDRNGGY